MLSKKQEKAVGMLARGSTITEVADVVGVTRITVHRWKKEEKFQAALQERKAQNQTLRIAAAQPTPETLVQSLIGEAHACLSQVLKTGENERARVEAAKYVLERYEQITEESSSMSLQDWLAGNA
jgi:hypothetical protein